MSDPLPAFSDQELLEKTKKLVNKYKVSKIYETGTFYGGSTYILSNNFPSLKIYTYELIENAYNVSCRKNAGKQNVFLRNISSPEGLKKDLIEGENNVFIFLDAHWYDYWPILDELSVIESKKIKPCIAIHDFFVPDGNGKAKFGHDTYKGQPLNFEYIKSNVEKIYQSNYEYCYSEKPQLNAGIIYISPKSL